MLLLTSHLDWFHWNPCYLCSSRRKPFTGHKSPPEMKASVSHASTDKEIFLSGDFSWGNCFLLFPEVIFYCNFLHICHFFFCFFSLLKQRLCERNPWAITFGVVHFHQESHYSCDSLYPSDTSVWDYSSQLSTLAYSLATNSQKT